MPRATELPISNASKSHPHTASAPADSSFSVYVLRCADDSLYVGHTANLPDRVKAHNEGRGAAWTACRRPVVMVYSEPFPSEGEAVRREIQRKGWSHAKKCALVAGDLAGLKSLAKRRIR